MLLDFSLFSQSWLYDLIKEFSITYVFQFMLPPVFWNKVISYYKPASEFLSSPANMRMRGTRPGGYVGLTKVSEWFYNQFLAKNFFVCFSFLHYNHELQCTLLGFDGTDQYKIVNLNSKPVVKEKQRLYLSDWFRTDYLACSVICNWSLYPHFKFQS